MQRLWIATQYGYIDSDPNRIQNACIHEYGIEWSRGGRQVKRCIGEGEMLEGGSTVFPVPYFEGGTSGRAPYGYGAAGAQSVLSHEARNFH